MTYLPYFVLLTTNDRQRYFLANLIFNIFFVFLAGPGSFLVRPSDNSPGDYSLFFHINNQIQRFRIEKKGVRYLMGGRIFECLDAVINRYRKEQIVEGYTLQHPVSIFNVFVFKVFYAFYCCD